MLVEMAVPLVGIIIFGVIGMGIFSIIVGKLLGESKEMAFQFRLHHFMVFHQTIY